MDSNWPVRRSIWLGAALMLVGCNNALSEVAEEDDTSAEVQSALKRAVGHASAQGLVSPSTSLAQRGALIERDGQEHVRFNRSLRGLRVLGGDVIIHSDTLGKFAGLSQSLEVSQALAADARMAAGSAFVTQQNAASIALNHFEGTAEGSAQTELIINAHDRAPVLAYEATVRGLGLEGQESVMHFIIDARTGDVQERFDENETAAATGSGKSLYGGTVPLTTDSTASGFSLSDPSRGNQFSSDMRNSQSGNGTKFSDADNVWGNGAISDRASAAVDAQYGTSVTWDYYKTIHNRLGIANNGKGSFNRVHYGSKYNNAFWSDSCFCMTYGDGDGVRFGPLVSLDVAGHEMTHGVTSRTANLIYSGESGGLNEATSDIFGTMVEFFAGNAADPGDYLIGEKLAIKGGAFRFMYNPALDKRSVGCYSASAGSLDVHLSSGIANHFFFLLAEGSNGTTASPTCNNSTVTGIGRSAAEKIWYRALTVYMTSSTNFAAARKATIKASTDLFGAQSAQTLAVASAWSAVSVN
jgi:zinc metalloprotease ZmpA